MNDYYKALFSRNDNILTPRLILRPFTHEDACDLLEYGSDENVIRYLLWDGVKNIEESVSAIDSIFSGPGVFAIEHIHDNKCLGSITINIDEQNEKADISYILNRLYWNRGYMTEALSAVVNYCFMVLKLKRVEAFYCSGNAASGRVMQKCGLMYEGMGKSEAKIKGVFYDIIHYGLINYF